MATLLCIDTTNTACAVGLVVGDAHYFKIQNKPRKHADDVLQLMHDLLREHALTLKHCDAIAINHGPGAFTSVRIGISVTQGLCMGGELPVLPISGLHAWADVARVAHPNTENIWVLQDARLKECYQAIYRVDENELTLVGEEILVSIKAAAAETAAAKANHTVGIGTGWALLNAPTAIDVHASMPDTAIAGVMRLASHAWQAGLAQSIDALVPNYLRDQVATPKPALSA